jgi:CheY-like chemotaxis protein
MNKFDYIIIDSELLKDSIISLKRLQEHSKVLILTTAFIKDTIVDEIKNYNLEKNRFILRPFTPSSLFESIIGRDDKALLDEQINKESFYSGSILLVEDNEINQIVARENLKRMGLTVFVANNGIEAINALKNKKFDMVLMDLQMPVMDGFVATQEIRKFNQEIPIIALSAAVMQRDKELTLAVGMNEHISKPIDINELNCVLSRYLKSSDKIKISDSLNNKITFDDLNNSEEIDIKSLIDRVEDIDLIYKVLSGFVKQYSDIDFIFDTDDDETLNRSIHSLKGVSGTLSLTKVYNLALKMNNSSDMQFKRDSISELKKEIKKVIEIVNRINV